MGACRTRARATLRTWQQAGRMHRSVLGTVVAVVLSACSDPATDVPASPPPDAERDGGHRPDATTASRDAATASPDAADAGSAAPEPCPAASTFRYACDGARRVRCVDGFLQKETCTFGCIEPAAGTDAACSCGTNLGFTRWNCTSGDLHACPGAAMYATRSCGGRGCDVAAAGVDDTCTPQASTLATVLAKLGPECGAFSPGTTCGIVVRDLTANVSASWRGDAPYVSASSVKAMWVAAALYDRTIADVSPFADAIFRSSDNSASGKVIDLLASPARVNSFMWNDAALASSGFCRWNYEKARNASNCPSRMGGDNFFTASDAVSFLARVHDRSLLGKDRTQALVGWMLLSPRSGYGGWLGTQIPAAARATLRHKAGWLPPSAVPGYSNSNDIGLVDAANGHTYAVALLMSGGTSYDAKQLPVMEYASCVVFRAVSGEADAFAGCTHP